MCSVGGDLPIQTTLKTHSAVHCSFLVHNCARLRRIEAWTHPQFAPNSLTQLQIVHD